MVDNHLGNQVQSLTFHNRIRGISHHVAIFGRTIDNRKIKGVVRRIQTTQQVKHLINYPFTTGSLFVDLVDQNQNRQLGSQRFFYHKKGLGHRSFLGINQQDNAVSHAEDTLYLTAKISMSRSINDVNFILAI